MQLSTHRFAYWLTLMLMTGLINLFLISSPVLGQTPLSLTEAIEQAKVQVTARGFPADEAFQPVLSLELTFLTDENIAISVPQGLVFVSENPAEYTPLIKMNTEVVTNSVTLGLIAYSLDPARRFPDETVEYTPRSTADLNPELQQTLQHISDRGAYQEEASQVAVWLTERPDLQPAELEPEWQEVWTAQSDRVETLRSGEPAALIDAMLLVIMGGVVLAGLVIIVGGGLLYYRRPTRKPNRNPENRRTAEAGQPPPNIIGGLQFQQSQPYKNGGMAEVWRGAYEPPGRKKTQSAVKFRRIDKTDLKSINYRFRKERYILGKLKHRNIVEFLAEGLSKHPFRKEQEVCLVQGFIEGWTIEELLEEVDQLPEPVIFEITAQILDALEYIHDQGYVHRDLTWRNIMVDRTGQVYLIDFGNATEIGSGETEALGHRSFGTWPFYAPETQGDSPANLKSDFYSLAVIIYAMSGGDVSRGVTRTGIVEKLPAVAKGKVVDVLGRCLDELEKRPASVSLLRRELFRTMSQPNIPPRILLADIVEPADTGEPIFHDETGPV